MELHTIGIDLGKTVFQLVGLDLHGWGWGLREQGHEVRLLLSP